MYNTFSASVLQTLIQHHHALQEVKAIKRGKQFQSYVQGSMIPRGSRAPTGGIAGDSYTFYAGMNSSSPEGINVLFNDAEVILSSTLFCQLTWQLYFRTL